MPVTVHKHSTTFDIAVITVCVDQETTEEIVRTVESTNWAVTASNFEAYISSVRRPYFGPQIAAAKSCMAIVDFDLDPDQAGRDQRGYRPGGKKDKRPAGRIVQPEMLR